MIRKIRIQNFMAHRASEIELSPGVTVITGPNNIGKSEIVEAIRHLHSPILKILSPFTSHKALTIICEIGIN
ncbi:MAG: hypothetical protein FJ135_06335 [Deltaproteobacteria bacterium]|nr:hypothetical protein [Deltaproteobacteria bacterium]